MLKITAIGNLTNDVELKVNETTGKPYAILRMAVTQREFGVKPATGQTMERNINLWFAMYVNLSLIHI